MRSAFAEAIEAFLASGGRIKYCPEGNALVPKERIKRSVVGNAARNARRLNRLCATVLAALEVANEPLTLLGIERRTGIPYNHLRGVMPALEKSGQVLSQGGGSGHVLRFRVKTANTNHSMSEVA